MSDSFRHFYLGAQIVQIVLRVARSSHNQGRPIRCSSGGSRQWLVIHPFVDYIGDKVAIRAGCANSLLSEYVGTISLCSGVTIPTASVRFGCNLPIARSTIFSLIRVQQPYKPYSLTPSQTYLGSVRVARNSPVVG